MISVNLLVYGVTDILAQRALGSIRPRGCFDRFESQRVPAIFVLVPLHVVDNAGSSARLSELSRRALALKT